MNMSHVLRGADRPGHQPRPVRQAGLAVPGAAHPGLGDRHRPGSGGCCAPHPASSPATRSPTSSPPCWSWRGGTSAGPARSSSWPSSSWRPLALWRWRWPVSFVPVHRPAGARRGGGGITCGTGPAVMTIGRLAPIYRGRHAAARPRQRHLDRLHRPAACPAGAPASPPTTSPRRAENLAHGFGALACRVRTGRPGASWSELVRRDALAAIIPALPVPAPRGSAGGAGRPARGRLAVAGPAARHPRAARRIHRRGEGIGAVGASSAACSPPSTTAPCGYSAPTRS